MSDFLYRHVGDDLVSAIAQGALKAGDRLPSVRDLCRDRQVSLATAVAAYRYLEAEGWIEARPKSGHFVRNRHSEPPRSLARPQGEARLVGISARAMKVIAAQKRPGMVQMGAASPDPSLFPAAALRREINRAALRDPELISRYVIDPAGYRPLREIVARRLAAAGAAIAPEEILITVGCAEALNLALKACTRPGDTILVEAPTYYGLLQIVETLGLRAIEIPCDPVTGPSLAAIEAATRETGAIKAALLVPNYANPLGSLMPPENKAALVQLLGERDIVLIEDDVYGEMGYSGQRPPLCKHWERQGKARIIACGSFTKTLAPGFRVGWIAPGPFRARVETLKFENTIATSPILQAALAGYLEGGGYDRQLQRLRERFRRQAARISQLVHEHFPAGTRLSSPQGGFVLWVELPEGYDGDQVAEQALGDNIAVAPGSLFSLQGEFRHCLRLNCGQALTPLIENAVRTLGRLAARAVPAANSKEKTPP